MTRPKRPHLPSGDDGYIAGLRAVVAAADELVGCPDVETLYRRAVELARERLGLERCSLFLVGDGCWHGTFGTARDGRTTDERTGRIPHGQLWLDLLRPDAPGDPRWRVFEQTWSEWTGEGYERWGRGWVVYTPIRSAAGTIGHFCNDAAVSGSSLEETKQEVTAVYCSLLGGLIEQKRAEEERRRQESWYRSLIEHSSDVIAVLDTAGVMRYASPSMRRVLGYEPEEMVGRDNRGIFHPEDVAAAEAGFLAVLSQPGRVFTSEQRCRHRNGSWRTLEFTATALIEEGRVTGAVVISRDVTERKLLEEQLRQSQKMEAIGRLAGGVAHDFNNMLAVINGYAALLLEMPGMPPAALGFLREIGKAGERSAALTRQLLAFSRRQVLSFQRLDLNEIVRGLEPMLRRLAGGEVKLVVRLDPDLGAVRGDAGQIEQVLLNLVVNARDAMPDGGLLTIETRNEELSDAEIGRMGIASGSCAVVAVRDTGSGIPPELLPRIFEPFFTTKERGRGTGLGLATVFGIVKQSGGHITVESEPGRGAEFRAYLPRERPGPEAETGPSGGATGQA